MAIIDILFATYESIKLFLIYGWWLIILVWIIGVKVIHRNWPLEAVIIEKRGNNLIKTNDRAGKYNDKAAGIIGYRLKKAKDTIPVYNYDWVLHNVSVPTCFYDRIMNLLRGNQGTIFLFRYGSKQYKPMKMKENSKIKFKWRELKDEKGNSIYINQYVPFDPRDKLGALDFEVVDWDNMNFMVQEQRVSIMRRQKKREMWMQALIPLAMLAVTAIICIVAIKLSFDFATSVRGTEAQQAPAEKPNIPIISDLIPGG